VSVLAFDLGASSGKALIGQLSDGKLNITEIHRFPNDPVQVGSRLHWDILRLFHEIKQGILKSKHGGHDVESIAIDSWAVDFGLIGKHGELLANPYHYRDHHTDGVMDEVAGIIPRSEIFAHTGLQFLPFNTIYQLYALKKAGNPALEHADKLLMIPDLLRYFLTGEMKSEFTNASTTQVLNAKTGEWDAELLERLGIAKELFAEILQPATVAGRLRDSICEELNVGSLPVITVGEHDTASAVAAVPALTEDFAYISCGTWSLLGTEVKEPVLSEQALELNFTNEGGVNNTYRLLKNIMGLWLVQECKRAWDKEGNSISFGDLVKLAEQAKPFQSLIDPDDLVFLNPPHMPKQIQQYCRDTNQPVPQSEGEIMRCVIESLALKYRYVLERTEQLSGKTYEGLNIVGGGIQNQLLMQFTANAIGKPVWAGPVEASAIGNIVVQLMALGHISDIREARRIIRDSFDIQTYQPQQSAEWNQAYERLCKLVQS
jgi:rhamnulokinase